MEKWETCFWFSSFPSASSPERWECGNRAYVGGISKELCEGWEACFVAFHPSVISTAFISNAIEFQF